MPMISTSDVRPAAAATALALLALQGAACGSESDSEPTETIVIDADAGIDATTPTPDTADAGTTPDATPEDVADAAGDTTDTDEPDVTLDCESASPAQAAEPTELDTGEWVYARPAEGEDLLADVRNGAFEVPEPESSDYGAVWSATTPAEDGSLEHSGIFGPNSVVYAATTLEFEDETTVAANADDMYRVFVDGYPQTGDVYGHGDKQIALDFDAGENVVVLQFVNRQSPKIELFETADDVVYNTDDLTEPELRVGDATEQPLGVSIVNTSGRVLHDLQAKVVENDYFAETTVRYPALAADAVTQVAFDLKPKSEWSEAGQKIPVTLSLTACRSTTEVRKTIELDTVEQTAPFKRTFRSPVDDSAQYYAVVPPSNYDPGSDYGLALALHGASVEAKGHATAYSKKDDMFIVAPTNRRRFGFDWESFGRLNGLNALDHAMESFPIDSTRVYVTGHSMGGHGTWHFGVMNPGRFATIGPSAGWASFYTYSGADKPTGAFQRARKHSETNDFLRNLADRGAYIIHGGADRNVPTQEGRDLRDALRMYTDDVEYHEEPDAKHWWNGDVAEGTDCVDWPALFDFFREHELDPNELDFRFESPGPWYSDSHSYVRVRSSSTPYENFVLESTRVDQSTVELTTTNVRSMEIQGAPLRLKGIETIVVDGTSEEVSFDTLELGPQDGKKPGQNGTFNQVFQRPFCFVYPRDGAEAYRKYAAYLSTVWSIRGNGHACALPAAFVDDDLRSERNLIYLGVPFEQIPNHAERPFGWSEDELRIGDWTFDEGVQLAVFPDGDRMAAAITALEGSEARMFGHQPFSSRSNLPDYLVFSRRGGLAAGFFDNHWEFDPNLGARR